MKYRSTGRERMVDGASRPRDLRYAYTTIHGKGEYYTYKNVMSESLEACLKWLHFVHNVEEWT